MKSIAIIPARGKSKRVPRKNVREFCGKPIIAYTIEAAIESRLFERVMVSTDDQEICDISKYYGAEVPYLRDEGLADDFTPVSEVTLDFLKRVDPAENKYDMVAQLMPNCPLRNFEDVINSYNQFLQTDANIQISVTRFGWLNPWWAMVLDDQKEINELFKDNILERSQDMAELYCPTGAIWWAKTGVFREKQTFHVEGRTGWEIPWYKSIDIDTEDDWMLAEILHDSNIASK